MKHRVAIVRARDDVEEAVREAIALLGGFESFAEKDGTYLVKPNLFTTKTAEQGATTDPRIIIALTSMLKEIGARPVVGECPATGSYTRPDIVFDGLGVKELCEEAGVDINVLDRETPIKVYNPRAEVVEEIWFPEFALGCDGIINVPKLKTHNLTALTCAVKNLFGLQQGGTKAHHHRRTANSPERFSRLLVDLYEGIRGQVISGADATAVDIVATAVMGWGPMEVGTNFISAERGLGPRSLDEVEVVGVPIDEVIYPFKRPQTHSDGQMFIDIRMPIEWYEERCTSCGICAKVCPGQAITMLERPVIDDGRCIQCFCCMELCPNGALRAIRPDE
jgi:uncharacterized protein (DUF362 family)/Pyruvate/2-oxoacid:ferredoxin oxidoreductase delta subunit